MERGSLKRGILLAVGSAVLFFAPSGCTDKIRLTASAALNPFSRIAFGFRRLFTRTEPDPKLREENRYLQEQLQKARMRHQELLAKVAAGRVLSEVIGENDFDVIFADVVVPTDSTIWRDTLTLSKGAAHGIEPGMLVVYHNYLVGRVSQVSALASRVILSTDPQFRIGVLCTELGEDPPVQRQVGVAQGIGHGTLLVKWLTDETGVRVGSVAVTTQDPASGVPKGIIAARIRAVDRGRGRYLHVEGEPPVNHRGLEYVMVLAPRRRQ